MEALTPQKIKDYETCPRYFDFLYNDGLKVRSNASGQKSKEFYETLFRVSSYYLYKKQGFEDPSLQSLYNRWERDWFGDMNAKDIAKLQNSIRNKSHTSYNTTAIKTLEQFYSYFQKVSGSEIFWLNEEYSVPVTEKKYALHGKADLVVRKEETKDFYIYKWSSNRFSMTHWAYDFISSGLALRKIKEYSDYNLRFFVWFFSGQTVGAKELVLEAKDLALMEHWIKEMAEEEFFPSRYPLMKFCDVCPFKTPCKNWNPLKGLENE